MELNFCRRCGARLTDQTNGAFVCEKGHRLYSSPTPSANIFFLSDDDHVLLSVRGIEPYKGTLDAIGGFIDAGENAEEALVREIKEETGLDETQYEKPTFLCSMQAPYPYDKEVRDTLPLFFWARLLPGATPQAADDISSIVKIPLFDTPMDELERSKILVPFMRLRSVIETAKSL